MGLIVVRPGTSIATYLGVKRKVFYITEVHLLVLYGIKLVKIKISYKLC